MENKIEKEEKQIDLNSRDAADIGILNGNVYLNGDFIKANLYIKDEKIISITTNTIKSRQIINASGKKVLPGFIDPHVHFHLGVGKRISCDDFCHGSAKGALGGITTYIDFLDPVKNADQIEEEFQKRRQLAKNSLTDYAFHTTIANPTEEPTNIIEASLKCKIKSIKLFTTYSDTDRRTDDRYIYDLLQATKGTDVEVVVHAENDELIQSSKRIKVCDHEHARPAVSENVEVVKLAQMARATGGNLYIVHVSAGSSVEMLVNNFSKELKNKQIILESCPHYFLFNSEVYKREDGYRYTMTPPLRQEKDRVLLNRYIDAITTIGTDHCPFAVKFKKEEYTDNISMGIGGIQYSFLNMYTLFQDAIIDKFTAQPAKAYGLYPRKGCLLPGADADVVVFDDTKETIVRDEESVYDGKKLTGAIDTVLVRGNILVLEGQLQENGSKGMYLCR